MKKHILIILYLLIFPLLLFGQNELSSGTGFFISDDGIIVTCAHVIEDGAIIKAKIAEKEYDVQILKKNNDTDLAVLKINYRNPYHFKITKFSSAGLGDKIFVLGFPLSFLLGADIRLTDGIVSAKSGIESNPVYFQLSAPVQPGNSGGPVINSKFEVIGVAAAKLNDMATLISAGAIPQNINFAIKSEYVENVLGNIKYGTGNVKTMNDAVSATVQILCYDKNGKTNSSVSIINKTGFDIYYVYVSPVSSNNWGSDKLGSGILYNGQSFNVPSLALNESNLFDIRLIDEDNDSYTKKNIRLSPNQKIEFTFNDIDIRANSTSGTNNNQQTVNILNKTGYTIYYVYLSPSSSDKWGDDLLGNDVIRNGQSFRIRLPSSYNARTRYDLMLEDSDGDTYTKGNILINAGGAIEFTIIDLD